MPKPNDELLKRILDDQSPASTPQQQFREATARWFKERRRAYLFFGIMVGVVGLAALYRGGSDLYAGLQADRTDLIVKGSLTVVISLAVPIFSILWSRIVRSNDSTLEQLLLLRSEFAQLQSGQSADSPKDGEQADLGALVPDALLPDVLLPDALCGRSRPRWRRVGSRILARVLGIALVIAGVCSVAALVLSPPNHYRGVTQVDQWRIAAGDIVVARSRIHFERPPADDHFVTLALPYSTAEITSITIDDRPLEFSKLDWRRYGVELPVGPFPWRPREILVVWELPVDRLTPVDGEYRTWLSALLPVSSYRLELGVDEESGYEIAGRPKNQPAVPFSCRKLRPERTFFGSCNLPMQKKAAP